jgi:hypothetical protein
MRVFAVVFALVFVWGCQDRPLDVTDSGTDAEYGSSVITFGGLPLSKMAASVEYKFALTITGDGMQTMIFSYPVSTSGQSFKIDKIPAGKARTFKGILYGSNGKTYEGTAVVDIYGGQIAYVSLVLRATGSAQVQVIIEDFGNYPSGCYNVNGVVKDVRLTNITMKILGANSGELYGYFYQQGTIIGKFSGQVYGGSSYNNLEYYFSMNPYDSIQGRTSINGYFRGIIANGLNAFKGQVYSGSTDSSSIGIMYGDKNAYCDTVVVPQPSCYIDTMGGIGSCKPETMWVNYATSECKRNGAILNRYWLINPCEEKNYTTICYECCKQAIDTLIVRDSTVGVIEK